MPKARHLGPGAAGFFCGLVTGCRVARQQTRLPHAGGGPGADHRLGAGCQAVLVNFQCNRRDVQILDRVGSRRVDVGRVGDDCQRGVDQVEDRTEVDGKTFLALADEHFAGVLAGWTAGHFDFMNMLGGIRCISGGVAERLGADVIDRFLKAGGAVGQFGHVRHSALAAIAANDFQRVAFVQIQVGIV